MVVADKGIYVAPHKPPVGRDDWEISKVSLELSKAPWEPNLTHDET